MPSHLLDMLHFRDQAFVPHFTVVKIRIFVVRNVMFLQFLSPRMPWNSVLQAPFDDVALK